MEAIKLNIMQKIQKARVELQGKDLKKSGFNKGIGFKYFELDDFLPYINEICNNIGLFTKVEFGKEEAILKIYDLEKREDVEIWNTPVDITTLRNGSVMQSIGAAQKYARRQLYQMAFEIAENDVLDSDDAVDIEAEEAKKKISKPKVITINKLIDETDTDINKFLSYAQVKKVEDITNDAFPTLLSFLNKKKVQEEKKKEEEFEF